MMVMMTIIVIIISVFFIFGNLVIPRRSVLISGEE